MQLCSRHCYYIHTITFVKCIGYNLELRTILRRKLLRIWEEIVLSFFDVNIGVLSWREEELSPTTLVRINYTPIRGHELKN
jgi:hypothetical protein